MSTAITRAVGAVTMRTAAPEDRDALVLERYEPVRRLGSGGFGTVWLARDTKLGRLVALKRIAVSDPGIAERARREAVAAARLQHSSIVSLYECAAEEDAFFLVSEYVRGATLAELQQEGALSDLDILEIGISLCDALEHAHRRGVVHRDVKPQNVMVPDTPAADGSTHAKLTDFGIARLAGDDALTVTGDVVGTLAYMAPEQAEGREATEASDLYSLGLCLYEALTGVNPVRARGAAATARRVGTRLPPLARVRRDLPLELCVALDTAVAPDFVERGTVKDLRRSLELAVEDVTDEPGLITGRALGGASLPAEDAGFPERLVAGVAAAPLAYLAFANLPPDAPADPVWIAAGAGILVAALPRIGWLVGALTICGWLCVQGAAGAALVIAVGVLPVPLLLWTAPWAWSLPGAAAVLGVGGVAGLFPALVGHLGRALLRAGLAAAGAWWALLAGPLTGIDLLASQSSLPPGWEGSLSAAAEHAIVPVMTGAAVAVCAIWAVAALVLPWIIRGRSLPVDIVVATVWTATTAAATSAACGAGAASPVLGAALGGCAVVALAVVRTPTMRRDLP